MGVSATGGADQYLRQYHNAIAEQEKAPGATEEFKASLEAQFRRVKVQIEGQAVTQHRQLLEPVASPASTMPGSQPLSLQPTLLH